MAGLERFMPEQKKGKTAPPEPEEKEEKAQKSGKPGPVSRHQEPVYDDEFADEEEEEQEEAGVREREPEPEQDVYAERSSFEAEIPSNSGPCILLSVSYRGDRGKALVKLYDLERKKVLFWYDNTGHQPYLLTDIPPKEILADRRITGHAGFDGKGLRQVEKHDLLHDRNVRMTLVAGKDPTSIGGKGTSLREILGPNSWEDHIRYHDCYIYDRQLIPGFSYRIRDGDLVREDYKLPLDSIREAFQKATPEYLQSIKEWFPIFVSPVPDYRRVAIDIEVATEALDRIPDPEVAMNQVICISLVSSDGMKKALILRREGMEEGERPRELPHDASLDYFDDELRLLKEFFKHMVDYPVVLTFNGDNFDMHYLWRRAQVLGMKREEIPIIMGREIALLSIGVHVDLYKFFHNHAIQIYAFGNAYKELTLDAIAGAFLDIKKIPLDRSINELSYLELASYCLRDSIITYRLSSENSNIVMQLTTLIMRISRLSMEDATRQGVSSWIRNLFYSEHRKKNILIPRQSDIEQMKGGSSTTAIIKGKKYQGAVVIKPESGAFFNVIVLDFASLYPSIIAKWNLSYETVRCSHPECKSNTVPGTSHWICTKRVGMMSLIIGLLREVRVKWFKPKSKDQSLSDEERGYYKVVQQALKVFLNACFTGDTEILTVKGVKNVKDIKVGDKVVNVNPTTLEPEVDEVIETQTLDYSGDLIHFENDRTTDLTVTPDHKLLVADDETGGARFTTAEEVYNARDLIIPKLNASPACPSMEDLSLLETGKKMGWGMAVRFADRSPRHVDSDFAKLWNLLHTLPGRYHKCSKTYFVPELNGVSEETINSIIASGGLPCLAKFKNGRISGKQNRTPVRISLDRLARLCGWIISEGGLSRNEARIHPSGIFRGASLHIGTTRSEGRGNRNGSVYRDEIAHLLAEIGIKYSICKKGFRFSNELLCQWIDDNCYSDSECCECGRRHCPHRKKIPDVLMGAGGSVIESFLRSLCCGDGSVRQTLYSTASETIIDQLPVLLAKLGFSSKRSYESDNGLFRVTWSNTNQHTCHWQKIKTPFSGKVHCLTTKKNHTVFAGRNGRLVPCGQCYGVFGAEIFPLYCLSLADSTTAIGRNIITGTINRAADSGVRVLYGDSVSGATRVYVRDGEGSEEALIKNIFKRVDRRSDDGREYFFPSDLQTLSIDGEGKAVWSKVDYVMRHLTGKKMYRVFGGSASVDVTEDHSLIGFSGSRPRPESVEGGMVEMRPIDLMKNARSLVAMRSLLRGAGGPAEVGRLRHVEGTDFDLVRPTKVEEITNSSHVYDLGVEGTHRFFANGILAHNTDSIFLYQPTKEQIDGLLRWAETTYGIDLEVDKRYTFVAFSGRKKNYLGVMENGIVDIKGLMGKKRNTPPFIKDAFVEMTRVLRDVKTPQDFANAKVMIKEIVQRCYNDLKGRRIPLDGLVFKVMLSRSVDHYTKTTPQHVKAAKQLAEKGKEVKPGDLISFVKVQGSLGVKPVQLARIDEVDVDKYVGHIESTFGQVLEALDIEFDEIVGIKRLEFFSR